MKAGLSPVKIKEFKMSGIYLLKSTQVNYLLSAHSKGDTRPKMSDDADPAVDMAGISFRQGTWLVNDEMSEGREVC